MGNSSPSTKAGFSLIEALIVLLVAGMALMLVFAIGGQSARTGFALGRRALAAADDDVTQDQLRSLIDDLTLTPTGVDPTALGLDDPSTAMRPGSRGTPSWTAPASVAQRGSGRPSPRGDRRRRGRRRSSPASAGAGPTKRVLADLRPRRARFAYSIDGVQWRERWRAPAVNPTVATAGPVRPAAAPVSLFIRLASDDGRIELVERASSGPVWLFPVATHQAPSAAAQ